MNLLNLLELDKYPKLNYHSDLLMVYQKGGLGEFWASKYYNEYYGHIPNPIVKTNDAIRNDPIHKDYIDQGIVTKDVFKDDRMLDYPMFNHYFYNISEGDKVEKKSEFNIADILLDYFIKKYNISMPLFILKCKANLTTQVSKATKDNFSEPHVDILETPHIGMICYMNDSDGDTFFFDKDLNIIKRVQPKRGRVVIFRGETLHSAGHPIVSEQRVVMNFDFKR